MGLDIYAHITTRPFEGDPTSGTDFNAFTEEVDADAKVKLRKDIDKILKPLKEAWKELQTNDYWKREYNSRYFAFVEKLRKLIAANYDWKIEPYTEKVLDLPELEKLLDKEVDMWYEQYNAYFRKVNFIFKYFEDRGLMQEQYFAFCVKGDIEDLIDRCERVLKDHDLAHSLLPTQSGFFFGSTDYDKWYFSDVKDCLRQMKKYLKLFKENSTAYWIFSW